jgi:hypothetical protein
METVMELSTEPKAASPAAAEVNPQELMLRLMFGKHITYSLSAVARLGVADHMNGAPSELEDLARRTGAHAPSLYRVMRMLAAVGVFQEVAGKRFALTPVGELLKTGAPGSVRHLAIAFGDTWSTRAFEHFTHCVRTGGDGVTKAWGKNIFELFADIPDQADVFHRAMSEFSAAAAQAVLEAYDFSGISRLADLGGGHGMLLTSVLKQYPQMAGVLYDLPEVVAGAPANPFFAECENRIKIESGSFFERVPSGCDAYILKHIIHDWSDEHCRKILTLIREQLPPGGRVLLCELVVPDEPGPAPAKFLDLEMLALTAGGKERTKAEFRSLFQSAGLDLVRIVETQSPVCMIEARAA